jgi:hypothetical protein
LEDQSALPEGGENERLNREDVAQFLAEVDEQTTACANSSGVVPTRSVTNPLSLTPRNVAFASELPLFGRLF